MERLISLQGATNFRDLGGYINDKNQQIKWGKIYRSDSLSNLSEKDLEKLAQMQVIKDYDLRSRYEQKIAPDRKWQGVEWVDAHVYEEGDEKISPEINTKSELLQSLPQIISYLGNVYQKSLLNPVAKMSFRKVFEGLLTIKENQAVVFHCTMGKDRTGMVAALILSGLGIDEETITKDYLLTNKLATFGLQRPIPSESELNAMIEKMNVTQASIDSIRGITDTLKKSFGGFEKYFIDELGFSKSDLNDLRKKYLIK